MKILAFDEQIKLLDGLDGWHTKSIEEAPGILMTDGPHGVRKQISNHDNTGKEGSVVATCFPTASLTACSFDRQVLKKLGIALAKECKYYGVQMILGPGLNIKRNPLNGRNFEYFSEDPLLSGELAASFVRTVEDQGVGTSVKHFIANNQETNRFTIDSIVGERALHEIYYKNFKRVIDENPASVMVSYNKMNGHYLTEHPILKDVLRKAWKYKGLIVSDWGAINDRVASVKASCDLEMPSSYGYSEKKLREASANDKALPRAITAAAQRVIELSEKYKVDETAETIDFNKQHEQARMIARESMVLAKNNENILPLQTLENVAIISGFAYDMRFQGGGSSHVNAFEVSQLVDIAPNYSKNIKVAKGFDINKYIKSDHKLENEALEIANQVKKVVYVVGIPEVLETEGFDRKTLKLPQNQIALFEKIYEINQNIVIVVVGGSVVNLAPFKKSKGVLIAYLGGQASSQAMMDILYGKVSPSGRLAETWIDHENSCNVKITNDNHATYYDESIFVGYRYYESFRKPVRYHFGHGLSYTKFAYTNFEVEKVTEGYKVSVCVRNIGQMVAKEVVMIFIGHPESSVYRAKRELKAFDKIELKPGESKNVQFLLTKDDFSFYDVYLKKFIVEEGTYVIELGKHAGESIEEIQIDIKGRHVKHPMTSYNQYEYNPNDFAKIYQSPLPPRNIKRKRPFDLSITLNEVNHLIIGKIIKRQIIKIATKELKDSEELWLKEVMKRTLSETPMRMISLFSNNQLSMYQAEGIIDILNLRFIKGIKKLNKK